MAEGDDHGQAMVRISSITRDLRFRPRGERIAVSALDRLRRAGRMGARIGGLSWLGAFTLAYFGHWDAAVEFLFVGGLGAVVVGGALQLAGPLLRSPLAVAQWRRLQGPRGGGSVAIRGRAVALRTVRSTSGEDVIAFRARFSRAGSGPEIERAMPFWLDDGQADPVLVQVEHLYLADPLGAAIPGGFGLPVEAIDLLPSNDAPTNRQELLLRAGDTIEATGWLSSEVDPSMSTHFRGVPMRRVLRGTPRSPLTVRRA